jgi:predicted RNA-binding Zn-ribbon protein involved in translation (DUF1610 family)
MLCSSEASEEQIWRRSRYIGGAVIVPLVLWAFPVGLVLSATVGLPGLAMVALKVGLSLVCVAIGFVLVRSTSAPKPTDPTSAAMNKLLTAIQIRHEEMLGEVLGERVFCPECGERFTVRDGYTRSDEIVQVKCSECGHCMLSTQP